MFVAQMGESVGPCSPRPEPFARERISIMHALRCREDSHASIKAWPAAKARKTP